jgi:hypothetical protein
MSVTADPAPPAARAATRAERRKAPEQLGDGWFMDFSFK